MWARWRMSVGAPSAMNRIGDPLSAGSKCRRRRDGRWDRCGISPSPRLAGNTSASGTTTTGITPIVSPPSYPPCVAAAGPRACCHAGRAWTPKHAASISRRRASGRVASSSSVTRWWPTRTSSAARTRLPSTSFPNASTCTCSTAPSSTSTPFTAATRGTAGTGLTCSGSPPSFLGANRRRSCEPPAPTRSARKSLRCLSIWRPPVTGSARRENARASRCRPLTFASRMRPYACASSAMR